MLEREAVLFANEAFYRAFADGDEGAMDAVWSSTKRVCCIHPGWEPLLDRDAIMASWRGIFAAGTPPIRCLAPIVCPLGDVASVICYEAIADDYLVATNVFAREGRIWRMVHHQAGPTRGRPQEQPERQTRGRVN